MSQADHDDPYTGSREKSALHATPNDVAISTVAIDLAKDVFELGFADADARIGEPRRLNRTVFARGLYNRPPLRVASRLTTANRVQSPCG
ncbi:hypothetical protein FHW13_002395 [Dokdonella fugitiva]|nr:hypothetical protein [Dokdonella fugitiva]